MEPTHTDTSDGLGRRAGAHLLRLPELNVAFFAFLLNFVWEMLQVPFFVAMPTMPHWDAVRLCARATLGDAEIAVVAFWLVSAVASTGRRWILHPRASHVVGFMAVGVAITIALELISTRVWHRWSYSDLMPVLPGIDVGLTPVLQWVLLPPLLVWIVRRQLT